MADDLIVKTQCDSVMKAGVSWFGKNTIYTVYKTLVVVFSPL